MKARSTPVDNRRLRAPRLVLRFAVLAAIGMTIAAAAILTLVRHAYTTQGEQRAVARARLATELVLAGKLGAADLTRHPSPARQRQLNRLFRSGVLRDGITSAGIYRRNGTAVYRIGAVMPRSAATLASVRAAAAGSVVSRLEGSPGVLVTYVPVGAGGRARGVIALGQPYGPIAAASRHSSLVVAAVLEGVLLALVVLLIPPLARASRRIEDQMDDLDRLATHDDLTGLPNRAGFRRELVGLAATPGTAATVMLVDLDSFHEINDSLGPAWGDALLMQAAERLQGLEDTVLTARLGEDEFGVLLAGADKDTIHAAEGRVAHAFAEPFRAGGRPVAIGARVGSASFPEHGDDADVLLRRAGIALSLAKETGTQAETYDPGHDASDVSRLAAASSLRSALEDGQLTVYYQPQADLASGAVRGVEALVRWNHPERGLLVAGDFIHAAERSDLIGEIDRFVLATAVRQWQSWRDAGFKIDIAVNLAAQDLLDPTLPADIEALLTNHGMPPEYLVLEITERSLIRTDRVAGLTLAHIHRLGARIAVDDYGTGYSSLAYLRNLRAQQVKLDRTFVEGIPGRATDEAIVRSTVDLAHTLGATVVAEGVETREQWQHLARLGCDVAQGFLIGYPETAADFQQRMTGTPVLRVVAA